ncbi:MAG: hypothetical protein J6V80_06370 [Clostridia bacterium]|nr:hypothetical protein [Clostridia bacterium]
MQFDYIYMSGPNYTYGFIQGNEKIVFIKPGLGSDCFGYENKYLKIAHNLNSKYGVSVICASNPHDNKSHVDVDKHAIEQYVSENNFSSPQLCFFGASNGGIKGLQLNVDACRFEKMVLVNMPLMINYHKTKNMIQSASQTEILAVYGERDPSVSYVPYIEGKYDNLKTLIIPGADHNFKGMLGDFVDLAERLM